MHPPLLNGKMRFTLLALFSCIGVISAILPIPRLTTTPEGVGNVNSFQKGLATELLLNQNAILAKQKSW